MLDEVIKELIEKLFDDKYFKKTTSGYYITTDELYNKYLDENYSIKCVRIYKHVTFGNYILLIKYKNGDVKKIELNYTGDYDAETELKRKRKQRERKRKTRIDKGGHSKNKKRNNRSDKRTRTKSSRNRKKSK